MLQKVDGKLKKWTSTETYFDSNFEFPFESQYATPAEFVSTPSGESVCISGLEISIKPIKYNLLEEFRRLNVSLLPVRYNQSFYDDIAFKHHPSLCQIGRFSW